MGKAKYLKSTAYALLLLTPLALTGCTLNIGSSSGTHSMEDHGLMNQGDDSEFSSVDIMFAQMMIPHHQQAVEMSTLAETRASSEEVKTLAATIKSEQSPEINQMKGWLDAAGAPLEMRHGMGMDGMLTESEMTELRNSTGAAFDQLFLKCMISHHEGAIDMAQMVISSKNSEVKDLAENIVKAQTVEINYMQTLLGN